MSAPGIRRVSGPSLAQIAQQVDRLRGPALRQKALGVLARELVAVQRAAFASESSPAGTPWLPLKTPRAGKILHVTGALERAATSPVFRGAALAFKLPVYGARQNFGYPGIPGGGRGHNPTPARPFMALDPLPMALQQRFVVAINAMIAEQLRR